MRFDSKLEEAFARDLSRAAGDRWVIRREPEAVPVGDALVFPDFALQHRHEPSRRWLLEVVGFWTSAYLERKLDQLARCGRRNLVLCVDRELACDDHDLPVDMPVIWFRRRIEVADVLAVIESDRHQIGVGDLFIDLLGRKPPTDPAHARLTTMVGRTVDLEERDGRVVVTSDGLVLAALSAKASSRWRGRLSRVRRAVVVRLEQRRRGQSGAGWRHLLQVDTWHLPIVSVEMSRC